MLFAVRKNMYCANVSETHNIGNPILRSTALRLYGVDATDGYLACRRHATIRWRCIYAITEMLAESVAIAPHSALRLSGVTEKSCLWHSFAERKWLRFLIWPFDHNHQCGKIHIALMCQI